MNFKINNIVSSEIRDDSDLEQESGSGAGEKQIEVDAEYRWSKQDLLMDYSAGKRVMRITQRQAM